jgi:hypothetical protein
VTVGAFLIGATAAGAGLGALAGGVGQAVLGKSVGGGTRLIVLAAALALAVFLDVVPRSTPGPRRQVNERWLDEYRGWVYGLAFGSQLGLGVTTVVSSAATYVALLAAFLSGEVARGALVLGCFGAVRGVTPLAAAHVRRPDQLLAIHAFLERRRGAARRLTIALLGALLVLAAIGALG